MLIAKKAKRPSVNIMTEDARWRGSSVVSIEKALLCWAAKKSPYIYPIQEPMISDARIIVITF